MSAARTFRTRTEREEWCHDACAGPVAAAATSAAVHTAPTHARPTPLIRSRRVNPDRIAARRPARCFTWRRVHPALRAGHGAAARASPYRVRVVGSAQ